MIIYFLVFLLLFIPFVIWFNFKAQGRHNENKYDSSLDKNHMVSSSGLKNEKLFIAQTSDNYQPTAKKDHFEQKQVSGIISHARQIEYERRVERLDAIFWAKGIFDYQDHYVILDTETTGIGESDVVIELGIINLEGQVLFNSRFYPTVKRRMSSGAKQTHGLSITDLKHAPSLKDTYNQISQVVNGKCILIYNAEFDVRLLAQTCYDENIDESIFKRNQCVMLEYAKYVNKWNDKYGDYKWPKLPGAKHGAIEDCLATLKILNRMANSK